MAVETTTTSTSRPVFCRMLSFREPLLLIPCCLLTFLCSSICAFFHNYASFLRSFARSLTLSSTKRAYTAVDDGPLHEELPDDVEEGQTVTREEVEEILARIGLGVIKEGGRLEACMGHAEFARVFDADEPSFEEVKQAFAVFDEDGDGFIGPADLQRVLAGLGFREEVCACRLMINASCGSKDGRMNLFQYFAFLENGFCS